MVVAAAVPQRLSSGTSGCTSGGGGQRVMAPKQGAHLAHEPAAGAACREHFRMVLHDVAVLVARTALLISACAVQCARRGAARRSTARRGAGSACLLACMRMRTRDHSAQHGTCRCYTAHRVTLCHGRPPMGGDGHSGLDASWP